jgi:predicted RNase H-like HicB family nuclease
MSEFYVAVLETNSEGEFFATVPDLPGVNTAAATKKEALSLAIEFANDYVRDLVEDGHKVPDAHDSDEIEHDPEVHEVDRALIPVEVPGKSVKISLSIDEALLIRADRTAAKAGLTRSGFFAAAVEGKIREGLVESGRALGAKAADVQAAVMRVEKGYRLVRSIAGSLPQEGEVFISGRPKDLGEAELMVLEHLDHRLPTSRHQLRDLHVVRDPKGGLIIKKGRGGAVIGHAQEPPRKARRARTEHKGN